MPSSQLDVPSWVTLPRYGSAALASVLPAAARRLGLDLGGTGERSASDDGWLPAELGPDGSGPGGSGTSRSLTEAGSRTRGIVLVLADGLGLTNLRAKSGYAPFLGAWECQRCLSGFPSTTVVSLGSFGTGLAPGQTALAGYSLRDPRNGQRASLIRWDGASTKPDVWQPHWTLFEQMEALGHPAVFVGEPRFAGSAMTRAALRGAHFISGGMTAATKVTATLRAARASDRLIYLYWGELDRIGHARGWESEAWAVALEELDSSLRQIAKGLPPGWEVWLTADHGMVDVTGGPRWEVSEHPVLAQDVDLIAGEPRALHLYTARPEAVADRWRGFFGPQAWVLTRPEAARAGLFGPIDQRVQPYLGDVVVALAGHGIVLDTAGQGPGPGQMVGHHGSLTETEMAIPLARWRAS